MSTFQSERKRKMKLSGVSIFLENRISSNKRPSPKRAHPLGHSFKQEPPSSPNRRPDATKGASARNPPPRSLFIRFRYLSNSPRPSSKQIRFTLLSVISLNRSRKKIFRYISRSSKLVPPRVQVLDFANRQRQECLRSEFDK